MKLKITKAITWGGSLVDETVLDVLVDIQSIAPSATFRIIEASSSKAGGCPWSRSKSIPKKKAQLTNSSGHRFRNPGQYNGSYNDERKRSNGKSN